MEWVVAMIMGMPLWLIILHYFEATVGQSDSVLISWLIGMAFYLIAWASVSAAALWWIFS